jgi:hypothetical protein
MRHQFPAAAFFVPLLALVGGFAHAKSLDNVPLKWSPTSTFAEMGPLDLSGSTITTKVHIDPLVDTRRNQSLVAENREHADVRPMTTSSDVAAFVTDHLKEIVHGAGLDIVDGGADLNISGEIRQFFVTETGTYQGEISLLLHVKDSAGKELWTGVVSGGATRWGRSYSAANYCEVMSDMLLQAAYNLLSNTQFHAALANR